MLTASEVNARVSTQTVKELSPSAQILLGKLYSPGERDRIRAAAKLANYQHPDVIRGLISAVKNESSEMVKRVILRSLGQMEDKQALPVILTYINSSSQGIQIEALGAAVNFSSSSVKEAVLEKADSPNPIVRQKAVIYLGKLKQNNHAVYNKLIERLDDISEAVRVAACKVLGDKQLKKSVEKLSEILSQDRSEVVRKYAATALGKIKVKGAQTALKAALEDSSPEVRITAAKGLAIAGSKSGLGEAIEAIKSLDARVRVMACEVIGMVGGESSRMFLEQSAQDIDRRVQEAAEESLKNMDKRLTKK
ncbi:HEAT repeat domain-containing protein [Elusimicrobiota bacterium]